MRVPGKATIPESERLLRQLADQTKVEELEIPTFLHCITAGGEAALIQFLITWAQRQSTVISRTFATGPQDRQIHEFSRRLYGVVTSLCSERILGRDGSDLTDEYRLRALKSLESLQGPDPRSATRSESIDVMAADHMGRGTPAFLYRRNKDEKREFRPRNDFVRMARYLAETATAKDSLLDVPASELEHPIGNILYELLKNTHDHARTDLSGDYLPKSFRFFQANIVAQTREELRSTAQDYPPLLSFCEQLRPKPLGRHVFLFSLSVVDSGPGFAQSWTRENLNELSDSEELSATLECFAKGKSSKPHDRFGHGLPLVRELLRSREGYLRLRTGRLSLSYNAFSDKGDGENDIPLTPWVPQEFELAPVAGSLLTLLIPIVSR